MSKYQYTRKHKLNGKKLDITNEIVGMMQINDYLLATLPKLTKLISEVQEVVNDESMTDGGKVMQVKQLFKKFENGEFEKEQVEK
jgi:hypothetical protein